MRQFELNPAYEVTAAPAPALFTAADLHAHLRVDVDEEDALIDEYIAAATELVEQDSRLYLRPAAVTLRIDRFPPAGEPLYLHRAPIRAVELVQYVDQDGDVQVWSNAEYLTDLVSRPARLVPVPGLSWPTPRRQAHAVSIELLCGFEEISDVPPIALQMVRLLVAHWFEHREAAQTSVPQEIGFAYSALLERLQWQA